MNKTNTGIAKRFIDEELGIHWQVDESEESLNRLLNHLEVKTNEKPYFEEALLHLNLNDEKFSNGLVVTDIGAGVCWESAILARHPKVKFVYAVDPSDSRLKHARYVIKHFGVEDKVKIIHGTFLEPNVPEKVDLILFCGSFHHCYEDQLDGLFSNAKRLLKSKGMVLITNEHYINWLWTLKRLLSYLKHFSNRKHLYYYPLKNLRAPDPFSGDHWRTRKEIENIFENHGFKAQFFIHDGNLLSKRRNSPLRFGWHFYHAILQLRNQDVQS
ncbi:MAG: hypothetical protein AMJ78_01090 [Omnitrophica WOR_2 bacterium SM23_29]|nr:MAG: hypothetical protein AMJ78_01090 [Omnitrophica WOR_2 bacterium SM23_29]